MKDKDLLKLLKAKGWKEVSIKGSHHKLKRNNESIVIPIHGKDLDKGLEVALLKKAGLK